ncbi:MAG: molecular chaperone Hsp33 [Rhodospirillaceae bacterium]|nr:molecular chaperone Hsp33 [Rhodospirillaceae bacterium]
MVPDLTDRDSIQPFQIDGLNLSGRLVRLGETVDQVLTQHCYPEPVSRLLGELMALAAALGSGLKFDGRLTAETRGDGPIRLLAVDFMSDGAMRGYASFDAEGVTAAQDHTATESSPVPRFLGNGLLALTVDQGPDTELYQGIVKLDGATLGDCAHNYFQQSDQVDTALKLAIGDGEDGWHAGALTLQRLAELGAGDEPVFRADREDAWRTGVALLGTATSSELIDGRLSTHDLLYRLFHEEGVRVFDPRAVRFQCSCSDERALAILGQMPAKEIEDLVVDGVLEVVCQFCNRTQVFTPDQIGDAAQES